MAKKRTTRKAAARKTRKDFANELQDNVLCIELHISHVGRSKGLRQSHKDEVADHFKAKRGSVGGNRKLFPPNEPHSRKIKSLCNQAAEIWKRYTMAYETGRRLIRRDFLQNFIADIEALRVELQEACKEADASYDTIMQACSDWLGEELFDEHDYPKCFSNSIDVSWGITNFKPSEELLQLAPETYEREKQRVARQFEAALEKFEQECRDNMAGLLESMIVKLSQGEAEEGGKKVIFRESAANNMRAFFARFKDMSVGSDDEMAKLVEQCEAVLGDTTMADVKEDVIKRRDLKDQFTEVKAQLDEMIVKAPARAISLDDLDD